MGQMLQVPAALERPDVVMGFAETVAQPVSATVRMLRVLAVVEPVDVLTAIAGRAARSAVLPMGQMLQVPAALERPDVVMGFAEKVAQPGECKWSVCVLPLAVVG